MARDMRDFNLGFRLGRPSGTEPDPAGARAIPVRDVTRRQNGATSCQGRIIERDVSALHNLERRKDPE